MEDVRDIKAEARAIVDELKSLGYDVFFSYATDRGIPDAEVYRLGLAEWDVYEHGNGTPEGQIGSIWYDAFGVIPKGDRLGELLASGALKSWSMD